MPSRACQEKHHPDACGATRDGQPSSLTSDCPNQRCVGRVATEGILISASPSFALVIPSRRLYKLWSRRDLGHTLPSSSLRVLGSHRVSLVIIPCNHRRPRNGSPGVGPVSTNVLQPLRLVPGDILARSRRGLPNLSLHASQEARRSRLSRSTDRRVGAWR